MPPFAQHLSSIGTAVWLLLATLPAIGQTADQENSADESEESDDIQANLDRDRETGERHFLGILDEWERARQDFNRKIGLDYGATYHAIAQTAILGGSPDTGASGDFTLQGVWAPGHRWTDNPTELRFRFRYRHKIGATPAAALGSKIGTLWGTVDGFTNAGFEIPDLYFQHYFKRSGILLRYGQLTIDNQFDANSLRGAKQSFLNQAFSANPAVAFPRFGAGLTLKKEFKNGFDIAFGVSTVQGTQNGTQVDFEFGSGDLFQVIQFGHDFRVCDDLPARIQLVLWHSDAVEDANTPEGQGGTLTYEQEIRKDSLRMISRFAWADGGATPLDLFAVFGLGTPICQNDFMGIAAGAGRSNTNSGEYQAVIEAFYRWRPRKGIRITPDLQLVFGNGLNESPGIRLIGGIRAEIAF